MLRHNDDKLFLQQPRPKADINWVGRNDGPPVDQRYRRGVGQQERPPGLGRPHGRRELPASRSIGIEKELEIFDSLAG